MQVFIDMDGVLADFDKAKLEYQKKNPFLEYPQATPGFFYHLEPVPGSLEAVKYIESCGHEVLFLTAPSTKNPHCWTEKADWIELHFGFDYLSKLIITERKELLWAPGRVLVDDYIEGKGQEHWNQEGSLIHFKNWDQALEELNKLSKCISVAQLAER